MMLIVNVFGWLGMLLILTAYYLNSVGRVKSNSKNYHLLNLFGALGIIVNTYSNQAWPAMTLNIFWLLIAAVSLLKKK
ncbi:hypothetical protein JXA63_04535 [Candidatus Woesebacteria bacterium]|nr:hypothetical protein [Candidatus Woesebacteria bacterium]